ncbi:MAG TPA: hypothetical protein VJ787_06195 [Thermoleophilia bacterium]|nr:hypothetical protein [Thermoleophilia bacterium]
MTAFEIVAAAFAITLPFGAWRVTTRRLSLRWFLAIHLPIPFIFLLRVETGYSYALIPFTVTACVLGQLVGGRLGVFLLRRRRRDDAPLEAVPASAVATPGEGGSRGLDLRERRDLTD